MSDKNNEKSWCVVIMFMCDRSSHWIFNRLLPFHSIHSSNIEAIMTLMVFSPILPFISFFFLFLPSIIINVWYITPFNTAQWHSILLYKYIYVYLLPAALLFACKHAVERAAGWGALPFRYIVNVRWTL